MGPRPDDQIAVRHYERLGGPDEWLDRLSAGRCVRSDVETEGDPSPWRGRAVFLTPADEYCDRCRDLINPDEWYGEAWVNVLARQKLKHGGTWCGECFPRRGESLTEDERDEVDDEPDTGRRLYG